MKPIIVISCVLCFAIGYTEAQTNENANKRVRQPEVPIVIKNSIARDFPQFAYDLEKMSGEQLKGEPRILYHNRALPKEVPSSYVVMKKGENFRITSVYNKDGKLLHSREVNKNLKLPKATRDQLFAEYNDWRMVRNREIVNSRSKKPQHFSVIMARGNERKKVLIDNQGKVLKEKKRLRV